MGKAKAAPAASTDGTAKLAGTAYHAASRSVAAREQALQAAGRLCDNGEKWAKRIGARQSPYEFIELWWSLPAATRACPPPQSNGEKCRRCKKVVRLARRQFIKRDEGSRLGREVRVVKCDGGCMGQGVSVIVNKWADYGYEAEEEEEDDDGGAPRRCAVAAKPEAAAAPRAVVAPSDVALDACSLRVKDDDDAEAKPDAARRRAKPKKGARKLLDLGAPAPARAYDDDAWDKPAPRAPAPAPRAAPPPQQPPSMDAFPSLGGGSPRTVAAPPPAWEPAYAPEAPSWEPAYAPEAPTYAPEAPSWSDPWAPEPEYFSREPEPYYAREPVPQYAAPEPEPYYAPEPPRPAAAPEPEPYYEPEPPRPAAPSSGRRRKKPADIPTMVDVRGSWKPGDWICACGVNNFHKLHGVKRKKCMACGKKRLPSCPIVAMVGDWICGADGCVKHNFSKNLVCADCGDPRSSACAMLPLKHGFWRCQLCDNVNYKRATKACRQCGAPKPGTAAPAAAPRPTPARTAPPPVASPFEQLATFLEAFGLRRHVARFREEEIQSLRDLPHLTLDDFIDMGLSFAEADTLASAAREML